MPGFEGNALALYQSKPGEISSIVVPNTSQPFAGSKMFRLSFEYCSTNPSPVAKPMSVLKEITGLGTFVKSRQAEYSADRSFGLYDGVLHFPIAEAWLYVQDEFPPGCGIGCDRSNACHPPLSVSKNSENSAPAVAVFNGNIAICFSLELEHPTLVVVVSFTV